MVFKQKCGENWSGNDQKAKDLAHGQILTKKKRFNMSQICIKLKKKSFGENLSGINQEQRTLHTVKSLTRRTLTLVNGVY